MNFELQLALFLYALALAAFFADACWTFKRWVRASMDNMRHAKDFREREYELNRIAKRPDYLHPGAR